MSKLYCTTFGEIIAACFTIGAMALNTTTGTGTQTSTGSPQTVGAGSNTAQSGSVQPGTATNLLNSSQGISLANTPLTTVNLGATKTATTPGTTTGQAAADQQVSPLAIGVCVLLFAVALVAFAIINRSAKNTT